MIVRRVFPAVLALTALLSSCRKPAVESYRVPKEAVAQAPNVAAESGARPAPGAAASPSSAPMSPGATMGSAAGGMAATPVATAGGAGLSWTAPAQWKAKPATQIRRGNFIVTSEGVPGEAELTITAFPGGVGGDLANVNRWRGQVQLPPVSQAEFEGGRQRLERNGLQITVVDIAAPAGGQRILGAIVPHGDATWFVKMGPAPDALVAKEKPVFLAFLDTLKPASAAAK